MTKRRNVIVLDGLRKAGKSGTGRPAHSVVRDNERASAARRSPPVTPDTPPAATQR